MKRIEEYKNELEGGVEKLKARLSHAPRVLIPVGIAMIAGAVVLAALASFVLHRNVGRSNHRQEAHLLATAATEHQPLIRVARSRYSPHTVSPQVNRLTSEQTAVTSSVDTLYQFDAAVGEASGARIDRSKGIITFELIQAKPSFDINADFYYRGYSLHYMPNPIPPGTPGGELNQVVSFGPTQVAIFENVYAKIVESRPSN